MINPSLECNKFGWVDWLPVQYDKNDDDVTPMKRMVAFIWCECWCVGSRFDPIGESCVIYQKYSANRCTKNKRRRKKKWNVCQGIFLKRSRLNWIQICNTKMKCPITLLHIIFSMLCECNRWPIYEILSIWLHGQWTRKLWLNILLRQLTDAFFFSKIISSFVSYGMAAYTYRTQKIIILSCCVRKNVRNVNNNDELIVT